MRMKFTETGKDIRLYMDLAYRIAERSYCERAKVGALIVYDRHILAYGWNGMPHGMRNQCECEEGHTKLEVIHAEENAISKMAASTLSSRGATMITTLSPCQGCSRLIIQSEIDTVIYDKRYDGNSCGLQLLEDCGIETVNINAYGGKL